MFLQNQFDSIAEHAESVAAIRCGRIVVAAGRLIRVEQHRFPSPASIAQIWFQRRFFRSTGDACWLDYHVPRNLPGYMTVDFIRSGRGARFSTTAAAMHALHEIARLRNSQAIVANVTNSDLTDRLISRFGWQRHLPHWPGRHFIRRFETGSIQSGNPAIQSGNPPSNPATPSDKPSPRPVIPELPLATRPTKPYSRLLASIAAKHP